MYQTTDRITDDRDAVLQRIDKMLDTQPGASDAQIVKLLEIDQDFADFFKMRDGAHVLGAHIDGTAELVSRVYWRRWKRDIARALGRPLPPSDGGAFDALDFTKAVAEIMKVVAEIGELSRELRKLQALAELTQFFLSQADLSKA